MLLPVAFVFWVIISVSIYALIVSRNKSYIVNILNTVFKYQIKSNLCGILPKLSSQDRFERTFELRGKGYDDDMVRFAQSAMSNMVGGIG